MTAYNIETDSSFLVPQQFDKAGTGIATPTLKKFYFQRAFNTDEGNYETWVSVGAPEPVPPSGGNITGLTTAAFWKMVV